MFPRGPASRQPAATRIAQGERGKARPSPPVALALGGGRVQFFEECFQLQEFPLRKQLAPIDKTAVLPIKA